MSAESDNAEREETHAGPYQHEPTRPASSIDRELAKDIVTHVCTDSNAAVQSMCLLFVMSRHYATTNPFSGNRADACV